MMSALLFSDWLTPGGGCRSRPLPETALLRIPDFVQYERPSTNRRTHFQWEQHATANEFDRFFPYKNKLKEQFKQKNRCKRLQRFQYRRWESNPHILADNGFWIHRVCHSATSAISKYSIALIHSLSRGGENFLFLKGARKYWLQQKEMVQPGSRPTSARYEK